jgi:hypothetical protein
MGGGRADRDRAVSLCNGFYAVICCIRHARKAEIHRVWLYRRQ